MARKTRFEPFPKASPVKITRADGTSETRPAYNVAQRQRVVGGGNPNRKASRSQKFNRYVQLKQERRIEHENDLRTRTWKRKPYWLD